MGADVITNIEFSGMKLTGPTKKVCAELREYIKRMLELHREPVLRVRKGDYVAMRRFAEKQIRPTDTLGIIKLDGREIFRYDGE